MIGLSDWRTRHHSVRGSGKWLFSGCDRLPVVEDRRGADHAAGRGIVALYLKGDDRRRVGLGRHHPTCGYLSVTIGDGYGRCHVWSWYLLDHCSHARAERPQQRLTAM